MAAGDNENQNQRRAFTLAEFAQMFGKNRSWAYRQVKKKRITTITGFGVTLVSQREIDRLLGEGGNS